MCTEKRQQGGSICERPHGMLLVGGYVTKIARAQRECPAHGFKNQLPLKTLDDQTPTHTVRFEAMSFGKNKT